MNSQYGRSLAGDDYSENSMESHTEDDAYAQAHNKHTTHTQVIKYTIDENVKRLTLDFILH